MRQRRREVRIKSTVEMEHISENDLSGGATNTADIRSIANALRNGKERVPVSDGERHS